MQICNAMPPFTHTHTHCSNEVLCNTAVGDWIVNARAMKALFHELDPLGNRPVSANQNGWVGPNTPLDVQGFDYSTVSSCAYCYCSGILVEWFTRPDAYILVCFVPS